MSTGQMQQRNAGMVRLLSGDLQLRYEPNFAWKSACSAYLALPALRAFWPMSSTGYTAAVRCIDLSGQGQHLVENGTANQPSWNYAGLAPYTDFDATDAQYFSRADGGVANWADIRGIATTEPQVDATVRGLTIGGWFWTDTLSYGGNDRGFIGKYAVTVGNQRSYLIQFIDATNDIDFLVSFDGTAGGVTLASTATITANTWYFIVGRFDPGTDVEIFLNDTVTSAGAGPASIFDSTADFNIGAWDNGAANTYLDGRTSLCFLCAAYLSDAIVLSLFHQTRALFGV